jgi:hypothetical protein
MPEHRDPESVTPAQRQAFQLIKQASALADAALADPIQHDEWLHKWHEAITIGGKNYKTLRGFVIAEMRKAL